MIQSVGIKNFKSVVDLTLELGTFNVLIGENGCGKSNILEAIAFGAAASADKLDFEFLGSRGIRVTNPEFMVSAFIKDNQTDKISLAFIVEKKEYSFDLVNLISNPKKWIDEVRKNVTEETKSAFKEVFIENKSEKRHLLLSDASNEKESLDLLTSLKTLIKDKEEFNQFLEGLIPVILENSLSNPFISNYIIYSLEQSSLRKFEETNQIYPLGIKGEGLFQYLKELAFDENNKELLDEIRENMMLLDWYEDFDLPENLMKNEFALRIKDKYLNENLQYFDQRSTNEGFLFLLFYATLFISKGTPSFFAIDNIDASFNPKLCMQLTRNLAALAKKHNKQVIVTTHNPAILDGLNLQDDDQRLFVVRRNDEGHTKANRIPYKAEREKKLSEIWTNGFIGGLPENF
jgi:predicted ATPase